MHFNLFFKSDYRFKLCIANGVTGIREMWTKMDEMPQVKLWRRQFYDSTGTIPRFGAVGTMVDGVRPSAHEGIDTASTAESARLLVQRIKNSGSGVFVKPYNNLSREVYFAIADESKKQNIPFAGHVPDIITLKEAAEAGQRSIEHLTGLRQGFYFDCPPQFLIDTLPGAIAAGWPWVPLMKQAIELCDEQQAIALFQYLAKKQVWQCPTLVAFGQFILLTKMCYSMIQE